jgi:hypothetical protein
MTSPNEQHEPPEDSQRQSGPNASTSRKLGWLPRPAWMVKPTWVAKPRRLLKPAWLVIAASLFAVIGLSAALVHVVAGGGSHPTASSNGRAALGTSAGPNPDATEAIPKFHMKPKVAAVTGLRSNALPFPKELRAALEAWDAGRGGAALAAVTGQLGNVTMASGMRQYVEMRIACVKLAADVTTAQASPSFPHAAMQTLYAKALAKLANGAMDCQAAVTQRRSGDETIETHENPAMLHASASAFAAGARDLYRATAEILIVSRRQ